MGRHWEFFFLERGPGPNHFGALWYKAALTLTETLLCPQLSLFEYRLPPLDTAAIAFSVLVIWEEDVKEEEVEGQRGERRSEGDKLKGQEVRGRE